MIFVPTWSLSMIPVADKRMAFNNSTTGATSGAVSAYFSGGIHFTPDFYGDGSVHVDLFFLCSVCSTIVCLFAQLHFLIVLSVLWFTASDYAFGMFKKFINVEVTESSLYNSRSKLNLPLVIKLVAYHSNPAVSCKSQLQNKKNQFGWKYLLKFREIPQG